MVNVIYYCSPGICLLRLKLILKAAHAGDPALQIFLRTDIATMVKRSDMYKIAKVTNITTQRIIEDITTFFADCEPGHEREKLAQLEDTILLVSFNFDLSSSLWSSFQIIPYHLITDTFFLHCLFTSPILFHHTPYSLSLPDTLVENGGWISEHLYVNNTSKIGYLIDRLRSLGNREHKYGVLMKSSYQILQQLLPMFSIELLSNTGYEVYDEIYILECDLSLLNTAFLNRYGVSAKIFLLLTESDLPVLQTFEEQCHGREYYYSRQYRRFQSQIDLH